MEEAFDQYWHNPSSPYRAGVRARAHLESHRECLAELLGTAPEYVVFSSGATEGNNAVFQYFQRTRENSAQVFLPATEHPSVWEAARLWFGERCHSLAVNGAGELELGELERALAGRSSGPALVSIMAANNETGVCHPWARIAALCRDYGATYHCDVTQWFGRESASGLDAVDLLTASAHKLGGPKGVGFVRLGSSHTGFHAAVGGGQENAHRGGTENLAGIAGMVAAYQHAAQFKETDRENRRGWRNEFEHTLELEVGTLAISAESPRLWNTSLLLMPRFRNSRWVTLLDREGFQVATGSACSTGKTGLSLGMSAMGMDREQGERLVRFSSSWNHGAEDWRALSRAVLAVWNRLRDESTPSGVIEI